MKRDGIRVGDVVQVDKRGWRFFALVSATGPEIVFDPFDRRVTYRTATAREVVGHWRRAGRLRVVHEEPSAPLAPPVLFQTRGRRPGRYVYGGKP